MSLTITIPKEYGYVLATATQSTFVSTWQSFVTGRSRKAAKIPYPNAYATAAEAKESREKYLFNCAQRAHANYLEHWPQMIVGLLGAGIKYPVISACLGVAWCAARVVYTVGYMDKNGNEGKGRRIGTLGLVPEFGLQGLAVVTGWQMVMG